MQAPTIYRLFGDKDGQLEAVAEHVMATYVSAKAAIVEAVAAADIDPLDDLRAGWDAQIEFGVAHPSLFRLLSDPDRVVQSPAARSGRLILESRIHRLALAARLRVSEQRAVKLIQAAGIGTIQGLLATPPRDRDPGLADAMYDAVLQQILTDTPGPSDHGPIAVTVALRAFVPQLSALSEAEQELMIEWLDRAINSCCCGTGPASIPAAVSSRNVRRVLLSARSSTPPPPPTADDPPPPQTSSPTPLAAASTTSPTAPVSGGVSSDAPAATAHGGASLSDQPQPRHMADAEATEPPIPRLVAYSAARPRTCSPPS